MLANLKNISKKFYITLVGILCLFVFCAFNEYCAYVLTSCCVIIACFMSTQEILELMLFCYPFQVLFNTPQTEHLYLLLTFIFTGIVAIRYLIELIKKEKKINFKTLIPISIFLLYLILPMHKVEFVNFARYCFTYLLVYLVFEYRRELDFKKLSLAFIFGMIFSSLMNFLKFCSPTLDSKIAKLVSFVGSDYIKFTSLFPHPNDLAINCVIAMMALFTCKYMEKFDDITFLVLFSALFIIGYTSVSRGFVLGAGVLLVVFYILYFLKYKKKALPLLSITAIIFLLLVLIMFNETKVYLHRLLKENNSLTTADNSTIENNWQAVKNGEIDFDPGREGLYKMYSKDILSSIKTFLFGVGISGTYLGQTSAHNFYLLSFWFHGLFGIILYGVLLLSFIKFNKKTFKSHILNVFVFLIPLIISAFFEIIMVVQELFMFIFVVAICNNTKTKEIEKIEIKENKNLKIPKIIHYIWLGGKPLPELVNKCIESWKKYCPDFEIKRWDESNLDLNKYEFAKTAYQEKKYAFASDVFRFDILKEYGGIYMDVDVELIKPIDKFLENSLFLGFEGGNILNPGLIMGAEKNHKILNDMLEIYKNAKFDVNDTKNLTICVFTTKYLKEKFGLKEKDICQDLEGDVKVYSSDYFCPYNNITNQYKETENTVSIHWYNASWFNSKQKFKLGLKKFLNTISFGLFGKALLKIKSKKEK